MTVQTTSPRPSRRVALVVTVGLVLALAPRVGAAQDIVYSVDGTRIVSVSVPVGDTTALYESELPLYDLVYDTAADLLIFSEGDAVRALRPGNDPVTLNLPPLIGPLSQLFDLGPDGYLLSAQFGPVVRLNRAGLNVEARFSALEESASDRLVLSADGRVVYSQVEDPAAIRFRPYSTVTGGPSGADVVCPVPDGAVLPAVSNRSAVVVESGAKSRGVGLVLTDARGRPADEGFVRCDLATRTSAPLIRTPLRSRAAVSADGAMIVVEEVAYVPEAPSLEYRPGALYAYSSGAALSSRAFAEPEGDLLLLARGGVAYVESDDTSVLFREGASALGLLVAALATDIDRAAAAAWITDPALATSLRGSIVAAQTALNASNRFAALAALAKGRSTIEAEGPQGGRLTATGYALLATHTSAVWDRLVVGYDLAGLRAAVAIDGPVVVTFQGAAFAVQGRPVNLLGAPVSGSPVTAVVASAGAAAAVRAALSGAQVARVTGLGSAPDVQAGPLGFNGSEWANGLASLANRTLGVQPTGPVGSAVAPVVVHAPSGTTLTGGFRGYGVLVVDGPFEMRGDAEWVGLVVVRGSATQAAAPDVVGSARIIGGLVLAGTSGAPASLSLAGRASVLYSPEALALAAAAAER